MVKKRPSIHSSSSTMNFRPGGIDSQRGDAKGTRPTTNPTSVREVLVMMLLHICKKILFFDVKLKVALYMLSLFIISVIGDFVPFPKTYFAKSDNLFNVYFVKMGWAWTLAVCVPYIFMTSYTICCGDQKRVMKYHLLRIIIATGFWFGWTKLFTVIENANGWCNARNYHTKTACLRAGHFWKGFDISGHAFILIYSSLVIIEEARPMINWECIKEHIRNEEYNRIKKNDMSTSTPNTSTGTGTTSTSSLTSNPLRNLNNNDILLLKQLYERFTPTIRTIFIGMTMLQLLWDVMLVSTMLYYHNMLEKVLSGIFAILTWFFTYYVWYTRANGIPDLPGQGMFNYQKNKSTSLSLPLRRFGNSSFSSSASNASNEIPKFIRTPRYFDQTVTTQRYTGGVSYVDQQPQQQQQQQQQQTPTRSSENTNFKYSHERGYNTARTNVQEYYI